MKFVLSNDKTKINEIKFALSGHFHTIIMYDFGSTSIARRCLRLNDFKDIIRILDESYEEDFIKQIFKIEIEDNTTRDKYFYFQTLDGWNFMNNTPLNSKFIYSLKNGKWIKVKENGWWL